MADMKPVTDTKPEAPAHTPQPNYPKLTPKQWRPGESIGSGSVRTDGQPTN